MKKIKYIVRLFVATINLIWFIVWLAILASSTAVGLLHDSAKNIEI